MRIITTRNDLRNWVDAHTNDWLVRDDGDVDAITAAIQSMDHPRWGDDWADFFASLPELTELLTT